MIQILEQNNSIQVKHIGDDKQEFLKFFNFIKSINCPTHVSTNGWTINKQYLKQIQEQFDIQMVEQPWKQMGEQMLLPPYDYQKEAIYFGLNNLNSLIILCPGSGKTPICIGIYLELLKRKITTKPGVICVKASLKYQWVKEIQKFSNLRAKAIDTPAKAKKKFDSQFEDVDLMVLNYETFKNETVKNKLKDMNIEVIMLDEIHSISNYKTAKSQALYNFNDLKVKIGFTATPITRDPENLFSIFNMINPDLFKSHGNFARCYLKYKSFGQVAGIKNIDILKKQIEPYIFIKDEEEIAKQLPKLMVNEMHCEMVKPMVKINNQIFQKLDELKSLCEQYESKYNQKELEDNEEYNKFRTQILAYQTFAQELIDDPRLLKMSDSNLLKDIEIKDISSPKLELLLDLLENLLNNNSKVCIFTRFERMQNILKEEIENKFKTKCAIINGSISSEERYNQAYDLFQDNDNYMVLIATNAMSEGISLSKCNYLIEYDLADSYAMQTQRHGRIKRANSIHDISYIYQLIVDEPNGNSWDMIAQKIINKKRNYDNDIIKSLNK